MVGIDLLLLPLIETKYDLYGHTTTFSHGFNLVRRRK